MSNCFADVLFYLHNVELLLNDEFKPDVDDLFYLFIYLFISRHRHLPQKRGYSGVRVTVTINQRQVSWSQTYTLHTRSYAHSYTLTLPHSGRQEPVPLAPVCCWSMCLRSSLLNSRGFRSRMCCGNPLKAVTAE